MLLYWGPSCSAADKGWSCSGSGQVQEGHFHPRNTAALPYIKSVTKHTQHSALIHTSRSWVTSTKAWKSNSGAAVMSSEANIWLLNLCSSKRTQEYCGLLSSSVGTFSLCSVREHFYFTCYINSLWGHFDIYEDLLLDCFLLTIFH